MSNHQIEINPTDWLLVLGLVASTAFAAFLIAFELWGEDGKDISSAAANMLDNGDTGTRELTFYLADPVLISVSDTLDQKVQMSIGFGDPDSCVEAVVWLTQKYRDGTNLVARSVEAGTINFVPPKTFNASLYESTVSACQMATNEQTPLRMEFVRT